MTEINYPNYKQNKAKGLWATVKTDKGIAISRKQFDKDLGTEITPIYEYFSIDDLNAEKTRLQRLVADVNTLLTDAAAVSPTI